jgi:YhcH/YjgK/YiaL family protein
MILDQIENAGLYRSLGQEIATALDYMAKTDFSKLANGRHEVDGDRVYAMVSRYVPRPVEQIQWEAHRRYVDIQYLAAGAERIGYAPLSDHWPVTMAYDASKDACLVVAQGDLFTVHKGGFAILGPCDVHAPSLALARPEPGEVLKVVMKCRVPGT